ncbi:MAG TPA: glycosyltransferase family 4 protein [Candidatus Binatia bacterium]
MRILWQNEHYPDVIKGGGGAINTYYITKCLAELGHSVEIVARGSRNGVITRDDHAGISIFRMPGLGLPGPLWPIWPLLEPRYLRPILAPVLSPFNGFVCVDAAYAICMKQLFPRVPLVFRVEGTRKGYEAAVPSDGEEKNRLPDIKRRILERLLAFENDFMDKRAWNQCDAAVVKSEFMKKDLLDLYRVPERKIHVIPNGVDFCRYSSAQPGCLASELRDHDEDRLVILYCGRLVKMKNLPYLFRAVSLMRRKAQCVTVVLGDGEEKESLQMEARALGIASQVKFLGHTEHVENYFAASDIFVLPSTYEPFGNALLEAMSAGLPCLALRPDFVNVRNASREIISDGETGYLVDPNNPGELAAKLDYLVSHPEQRKNAGQQGKALIRTKFSWTQCASRYVELLQQCSREG